MKKDHYKTLGVDKGAKPEQIKRAYRKRAKETHPDVGGNIVLFREVQSAYDTLGDDAKRERYDRTGVDGDQKTPMERAEHTFPQLVVQAVTSCRSPGRQDIINVIKHGVKEGMDKNKMAIEICKEKIKKFKDAARRLKRKRPGFDPSVAALEMATGQAEIELRNQEEQAEVGKCLLQLADEYEWQMDKVDQPSSFAGWGGQHQQSPFEAMSYQAAKKPAAAQQSESQ